MKNICLCSSKEARLSSLHDSDMFTNEAVFSSFSIEHTVQTVNENRTTPRPGSRGPQTSAHTIMDEADFSEDTTYKQEDLPYDGDFSQMKMCTSYNFILTNDTFPVPVEAVMAGEDLQKMAAHREVHQDTALPATWDKMTQHVVSDGPDKDKQCALASPGPANKEDTSKSHISDSLQCQRSREQFFRGQGVGCETFLETSKAESLDDSVTLTNIISCYAKNYYPKEQTPELSGQTSPPNGSANSSKPCCSTSTEGEVTSPLGNPVTAGKSSHQEDPSFLTGTKGPSDKYKSCLGQTPQRQLPDKASSGNWFRHSQAPVQYQLLPDLSKVAPKVKISKNTVTDKPPTVANQGSYSPRLRNKTTVVQDNLGTVSRSNRVEKQPEQKRKFTEPSQHIQVNENVPCQY